MKRPLKLLPLLLLLCCAIAGAAQAETTPEEEAKWLAAAQQTWDALDLRQGDITLPNGVATLNIPQGFYYIGPADAERLLVDLWGNPPGAGKDGQGMLFPADFTPFADNGWAVTINYAEDGYVSDEDADDIDYDDLLRDMKSATEEENEVRARQGYEPIELVGWASPPFYDTASHKLHWARELRFGDAPVNTLNYNIRVLGRKGVLVLNFVADMDQKPVIDANIDTVLALAEFDQGSRYQDFDPDIDTVAAYGLGALVAGKAAAKLGLFAAALVFLKKFGVLILVGLGWLGKKLFSRRGPEAE